MANVIFRRGLQSALNSATHVDGQFLLTTDTNRLYADLPNNQRVLLNQTVQIVENLAALTSKSSEWATAGTTSSHVNDFYYIKSGNILAVYTGESSKDGGWVQINPDTNTTISSLSFGGSSTSNGVALSVGALDSDNNSVTATMSIVGNNGVTVALDDGKVKISGDPYTLTADAPGSNQLRLFLNNSTTGSPVVIQGIGATSVTKDGSIYKINSENTTVSSLGLGLPTTGSLAVSLIDTDSNSTTATLSNVGIILHDNSYLPLASTAGGLTAGSIYSAAEIEDKLKGLDGMTYKGTFGDSSATVEVLPTSNVKNGDVYVVVKSGLTASSSAAFAGVTFDSGTISAMADGTRVGDMFIAKGTENSSTGFVGSDLKWTYIPSGNDALDFVTYSATANSATHSIQIHNANNDGLAQIALSAGQDISLSSAVSTDDHGTTILSTTVSHATITTTTAVASSLSEGTASFTAIRAISTSNGHVVSITTDVFTPVVYDLGNPTVTAVSSKKADVALSLMDQTNSTTAGVATFGVMSDNLTISATASNVLVNFEWGSF